MPSHTHKQEMRILDALLTNLRAAGFAPAAVWIDDCYLMPDAEGTVREFDNSDSPTIMSGTARGADECADPTPDFIYRSMTDDEVRKVFEDYDLSSPTVHFTRQHVTEWGNRGIQVVPGNGCDFICDWHCGRPEATGDVKAFDAIVTDVAKAAGDGAFE